MPFDRQELDLGSFDLPRRGVFHGHFLALSGYLLEIR